MSSMGESVNVSELDALMKEFPDWREEFPDIYRELNPPRFHKSRREIDPEPPAPPVDGNDYYSRLAKKKRQAKNAPQTDYQATYHKHKLRPRSTKKPPPDLRDPNPPAMTFDTNQRSAFVPKDLSCRPELMKKTEEYQPSSSEPFNAKSCYQVEFEKRNTLPEITRPKQTDYQRSHLLKSNSAKFDDRTTTKDHYKQWVPQPVCTFGDLPVFTGSILYPGQGRNLETTNNTTFKGTVGRRSTPCNLVEGTLKPEGHMDMDTVNRLTYHSYDNAQPAQRIDPRPDMLPGKRSKFNSVTQSQSDFPGFKKGGQPMPPPPAEPPQATINLKIDKVMGNHESEQRREFRGIDTQRYPVEIVSKKTDEYKTPTVKFETMTNQKLSYQPIDISEAYCPRVKAPLPKFEKNPAKLDDLTMSKHFFKKYEVQPRVRHGDFHENHSYIPPREKFNGVTTTRDTYRGPLDVEIPASFKPEQKPINAEGTHDFNTMYQMGFTKPSDAKQLSRKQQALLYRELRRRKKTHSKGLCAQGGKHAVAAK